MIDKDLDYCLQQIEAQEEKCEAIKAAIKDTKRQMLEADQAIESAKKEKNRIGHMFKELESKWGNEKRILGNMLLHRHELKQLKQMMKNQHKMIRDKTCQ